MSCCQQIKLCMETNICYTRSKKQNIDFIQTFTFDLNITWSKKRLILPKMRSHCWIFKLNAFKVTYFKNLIPTLHQWKWNLIKSEMSHLLCKSFQNPVYRLRSIRHISDPWSPTAPSQLNHQWPAVEAEARPCYHDTFAGTITLITSPSHCNFYTG